ncbi:MAG: hypothetical protein EOP06_15435, partial [Proteobacteria bacterium]
MRKTSLFWPLASVGFALTLSGCSTLTSKLNPPPAPDVVTNSPPTKPTAETAPAPAAAPDSHLVVSLLEGTLTVSLNGRKVGDYGSTIQVDASPYLKPGKNTLTVDWEANTKGMVKV